MKTEANSSDVAVGRIFCIAAITAISAASVLIVATYCYAVSYDPWLTPRFTHYMRVLWMGRDVGCPFLLFALLVDLIAMTVAPSSRWRFTCIAFFALGACCLVWAIAL